MGKPLVLLDVDGVVCDFMTGYLDALEAVTGVRRLPSEVTQWDVREALGLSTEAERLVEDLVLQPRWCASLSLYTEAAEGVRHLREVAEVHVVTAPWPGSRWWPGERVEWLDHHLGFEPHEVTLTHRKALVRGDALIDDRQSHLVAWKRAHPGGLAVLWDRPWNRSDAETMHDVRARSWDEVLYAVSALR